MKTWKKITIGGILTLVGAYGTVRSYSKAKEYERWINKRLQNSEVKTASNLEYQIYRTWLQNSEGTIKNKKRFLERTNIRDDPNYLNELAAYHKKRLEDISRYRETISPEVIDQLEEIQRFREENNKVIGWRFVPSFFLFLASGISLTGNAIYTLARHLRKRT